MTSLPKDLEISPEDLDKISGGFFFLVALAAVALAGCGGALKEKASSSSTFPGQPK
jgi:hypothetical protein